MIAVSYQKAMCGARSAKTYWIMPAADGATVPNVCTCAITS